MAMIKMTMSNGASPAREKIPTTDKIHNTKRIIAIVRSIPGSKLITNKISTSMKMSYRVIRWKRLICNNGICTNPKSHKRIRSIKITVIINPSLPYSLDDVASPRQIHGHRTQVFQSYELYVWH